MIAIAMTTAIDVGTATAAVAAGGSSIKASFGVLFSFAKNYSFYYSSLEHRLN
jgi:hypothetical protein